MRVEGFFHNIGIATRHQNLFTKMHECRDDESYCNSLKIILRQSSIRCDIISIGFVEKIKIELSESSNWYVQVKIDN